MKLYTYTVALLLGTLCVPGLIQGMQFKNTLIDIASEERGSTGIVTKIRNINACLANGEDINNVTPAGYTPLMAATFWRNHQVMQLLIERGASLTLKNNMGETALDIAKNKNDRVALAMFEKYRD
ncbi:MAG: ankyrin repeat domain-containing protein [Candidatus Dependentiae bacterium]|nr:ankyrin repeat domain-containing protein [Candidatus Dependentiae bacterium]